MNPRAGFIQPTPLAGEPLRPLGYFRVLDSVLKFGGESGIRTHGHLRAAGFQDRFLQPLGHLSTWKAPSLEHESYHTISPLSCQQNFAFLFQNRLLSPPPSGISVPPPASRRSARAAPPPSQTNSPPPPACPPPSAPRPPRWDRCRGAE